LYDRILNVEEKYVRSTRFEQVGQASGTATIPEEASVILDDFGGTVDAVVSALSGGRPSLDPVFTTAGAVVSTSFDSSGNYAFSGAPASYPVGIIYRVRQKLKDFDSDASGILGAATLEQDGVIVRTKIGDVLGGNYTEFEADGTMRANGEATTWDDVYPSSVTVLATGPNAAGFTSYSGNFRGYEFLGTGVSFKEVNMGFQFNHSIKVGSVLAPHLHLYIPNSAASGVIRMYAECEFSNIGDTGAVSGFTVTGSISRLANAGISRNHILEFDDLSVNPDISGVLMMRVYRNPADAADTFGSSVWLKSSDVHIEKDTLGSRQEYSK
jgi:hypothetical protein